MRRVLVVLALLALASAGPAAAGTITFAAGQMKPGVGTAINDLGQFSVWSDNSGLFGATANAYDFHLDASGKTYSDAGLVLFLDGSFTLGQLQAVSANWTGSPLAVNLWFDSGNDAKFFAVDGTQFTGLNGDSYAGGGQPAIGLSTRFYMFGGNGAGRSATLADLQNGAVEGIDGNTRIALWLGITNPGNQSLSADISSITVTTTEPVPEPASMLLLGTGLIGAAGAARRRVRK